MAKDIVVCFLLQTGFTVGSIYLFGFLIGLCNRRFYANFGRHGAFVCRLTGAVGTPVHEASHALMCLLFGHRIVEMKLYRIDASDGVLGYVTHTYNKRNFYQSVGNFFIGVAPIIVISLLLALFSYLLLPQMFGELVAAAGGASGDAAGAFRCLWDTFVVFFSYALEWKWWIFLFCSSFFALHMTLSKADVKGAASGVIFLLILLLIADTVLSFLSGDLLFAFTGALLGAANFMICFLLLSLLIALIALFLSWAVKKLAGR